ncbi:MAG: DUF3179 domain-containing protein [Candidatus Nomurabacteria bacterium]|nr:DUF3179 domain-containing protein [Candidatus Nomurabacteria bacterium]USN87337.1 MAG: DUF3179 domain-containing protein [Candidatus Nomurabacteria bacterium]
MTLLIISFLAGVLTVLAPCVLPLLPVVIGSSVGARSRATPYIVIGSLALSILLFTYLLKASTALISIPAVFWSYLSGGILAGFGLILLFPVLWESLPFVAKASRDANQLMSTGYQKKSVWGDVLIGASLGPVFSTCSPTYFVILGTVLPASFWLGTVYLITYLIGLILVLALIALLGQRLTGRLNLLADNHGKFKRGLGVIFLIVGLAIISGLDKKIEAAILDTGYLDISKFEQKILDSATETSIVPAGNSLSVIDEQTTKPATAVENIPKHLQKAFPKTDWSKNNPNIANAISGGPGKDGIPAIDNPTFVPIFEFSHSDETQAIVVFGENDIKVYPYNILNWHEIVNDEIDGKPILIAFCPLCWSAIVYDRTLPDGKTPTFGVSGSLLESNMIMYDRLTESLWQQSTGKVLAGTYYPAELTALPFQLLTIGEIKKLYPYSMLLSEDTGYSRDYSRDPYVGYETNSQFVFDPSSLDNKFPPKTIMVVFRAGDVTVSVPWLKLREVSSVVEIINNIKYTLTVTDTGELIIVDESGAVQPFYFEMWFSFAVQHSDQIHVIEL